ncbi:hypothetical protein CRG98_035497 [Punica granatum]|uniref:Uncharacterized protein n=1 Tax=Punica granatum TaxID=22663 RepID=A0A2I0IJD8_PUNGR|nr:hypothetical protein CRG98_035497 [Punica granatum]
MDSREPKRVTAPPRRFSREASWLSRVHVGLIPPNPSHFGKRVGDVAVGVARLGLKLRAGDPGGGRPRQLGKNVVGTFAPATARCGVGLVGLLRSRSRCSWADLNVPSPGQIENSEKKLGMNPNDPVRKK